MRSALPDRSRAAARLRPDIGRPYASGELGFDRVRGLNRVGWALLGLVISALAAHAAHAQTAAAPTSAQPKEFVLEEIVVTATRRNESIVNVPISVSAYSQETLDQRGVEDIADLSRITPGITFTPGTDGTTIISIRGISSSGIGTDTTGVYIDDTPIQVRFIGQGGHSTNAYPALFDLDRVEVLRGPQGTLFGAGSEGGTVRFVTPEPSLTSYNGYARAQYATTEYGAPSKEIGAAVGGPLVPGELGFRVSAYYRADGGWIDQVAYPSPTIVAKGINSQQTIAMRAALGFAPTDRLTVTPTVFYQETHRDGSPFIWRNLSDPAHGIFESGQPLAEPDTDRLTLYATKVQYHFGGADLISNTAYLNRSNAIVSDYSILIAEILGGGIATSPSLGVTAPTPMVNTQRSFTQEVRLQSGPAGDSKITWIIGGFYQESKWGATETAYAPALDKLTESLFGSTPVQYFGIGLLPGDIAYLGLDKAKDKQTAGFGQVDYPLNKRLTATVGVRVAKTEFSFTNFQNGPFNGGQSSGTGGQSGTPVTPRFGLEYKPPNTTSLIYASIAKGFRTGGANTPVPSQQCMADLKALGLSEAPTTYSSDSVWSYELGSKGVFLNQRLQLEASAFYINWRGIQAVAPLLNCGFSFTTNLAAAVSKGFDVHASVRPRDGLTLDATVGYTDGKYSGTVLGSPTADGSRAIIVANGDPLAVAPWHVSSAATYELPIGFSGDTKGYLHADYDVTSGTYVSGPTTVGYDPSNHYAPATHFASARIGVRRAGWDVSAFAENVFNSTSLLSTTHDASKSPLLRDVTFRQRTIGLTASVRF